MHEHEHMLSTDDLDGAAVARLGVSHTAALTADALIPLVPTTGDHLRPPVGLLREALRARKLVNELISRTITSALLHDADWGDIAAALGTTTERAIYRHGHLESEWLHLTDDPWEMWEALEQTCNPPIPGSCSTDPAEVAHYLDAWCRRHGQDPREAVPISDQAVSAGLAR